MTKAQIIQIVEIMIVSAIAAVDEQAKRESSGLPINNLQPLISQAETQLGFNLYFFINKFSPSRKVISLNPEIVNYLNRICKDNNHHMNSQKPQIEPEEIQQIAKNWVEENF